MTNFEREYYERKIAKTYKQLFNQPYPRKIAWNPFSCRHASLCYTFKSEDNNRYCIVSCMKCKEDLVVAYTFEECRDKINEYKRVSLFQSILEKIKYTFNKNTTSY